MDTSLQRGPKETPDLIPEIAPLSILVVDDSRSFGDLAATLLELDLYARVVGVASSGAEALEKVALLNPEVVLMDVHMSPMGGLAAAALIGWLFPQSRVVMMSTDDSPRLRAECAASGAAAFINKSSFVADVSKFLDPITRDLTLKPATVKDKGQTSKINLLSGMAV
jgi:DNA-binding NarL/FixJ family response regulator